MKMLVTYKRTLYPFIQRHYKVFCVNVKYRIQNRVLYFLFYIFTPKE